tara:strand:+ start:138 stop:308 length:171 start_codon:yes stop_codon:yes gene_type:complete
MDAIQAKYSSGCERFVISGSWRGLCYSIPFPECMGIIWFVNLPKDTSLLVFDMYFD